MKGALNGLDLGRLRVWVIVAVIAAVLLLLTNTLFSSTPAATATTTGTQPESTASTHSPGQDLLGYETALAANVSAALATIQGAGKVTVSLNLHGGPSYLYAFNQTTHTTQSGAGTGTAASTDTTSQTQLATAGSGQTPVLTQEVAPKVVGALIVATGAKNPIVRQEISQAAQALLGVPAYEIEVLPGGGQ